MSRSGYVLVGGRSTRMGRDKALLPYRGALLGWSVARSVELAAGSAILVGNPDLHAAIGFPGIADGYPGQGPLGGILTALRHTAADWNLVVACDMPELSPDFLRGLLDAAEKSGADALVPRGPSGRPEPLCAVYHRRALAGIEAAFARGIRKVMAALDEGRTAVYHVPEPSRFQNVNSPEDWAGYAAR